MNYRVLVRKNLFRHKLRASLMIVCILTAFAIFGVLASIERSVNAGQDLAAADRLVVVNKISFTQPLPIAYVDRVRAVDGVQQVTHVDWFGGYYQDPKNSVVALAVDPVTYIEVYGNELDISPEARQSFVRDRTGALVGEAMAKKWGWKVGDHVPIASNILVQKNGSRSWDFNVVGIFKGKKPEVDTNFMVFQYDYLDATRALGKGQIGWMVLRTASPEVNDRVARTIDQTFANSAYETSTDTEKALNKAFVAQFGNIKLIMVLVVGAAFVTILMIVGNTLMMGVRERTREIGVLKSLGFPPSRILRLVLGESVLLALIGGLSGLGLAALFIVSVRDSVGDSIGGLLPKIPISPEVALTGLALMLGFGIVTGLIPALNAMRLRIGAALGRS
jgi:putative ABC transport system permease protein